MGAIAGAYQATMDMSAQRSLNADLRAMMQQKAQQVNEPGNADRAALEQGSSRAQQASRQQVKADELTTAAVSGIAATRGADVLATRQAQLVERQTIRVSDGARAVGPTAADALSRARVATLEAAEGARPERAVQEQLRQQMRDAPDPASDMRTGYVSGMRLDAFA